MSDVKLIASDLDGTLLLNGAFSCNPEIFSPVAFDADEVFDELGRRG